MSEFVGENYIEKYLESDDIGGPLLEGLTTRLYDSAEAVIREYVCNSIDARAEKVEISWPDPAYDRIIILDNGKGMKTEDLKDIIGILKGTYEDGDRERFPTIGRFGIGLYAGGNICERIEIRSTAYERKEKIFVIIPIEEWLKDAKFDRRKEKIKSIKEVTKHFIKVEEKEEFYHEQGTTIILHNIKDHIKEKIRIKEKRIDFLTNLCCMLPLDFPPEMSIWQTKFKLDPPDPENLDYENYTKEFLKKIKNIMDKPKTMGKKKFSCNYNNIEVLYNGNPLYRPYPSEGIEKEPLAHVWFEKDFWIDKEDGTKELVGVGWVVVRGPTGKAKGKVTGNFSTNIIRGIQIRLFNVEVIPFNKIWSKFKMELSSYPIYHFWGEIHLFNEDIEIPHKRDDFLREIGCYHLIHDQITEWIDEIKTWQENYRKSYLSWWRKITRIIQKDKKFPKLLNKYMNDLEAAIKNKDSHSLDELRTLKEGAEKVVNEVKNLCEKLTGSKGLTLSTATRDKNVRITNLDETTLRENLYSQIENLTKTNKKLTKKITTIEKIIKKIKSTMPSEQVISKPSIQEEAATSLKQVSSVTTNHEKDTVPSEQVISKPSIQEEATTSLEQVSSVTTNHEEDIVPSEQIASETQISEVDSVSDEIKDIELDEDQEDIDWWQEWKANILDAYEIGKTARFILEILIELLDSSEIIEESKRRELVKRLEEILQSRDNED